MIEMIREYLKHDGHIRGVRKTFKLKTGEFQYGYRMRSKARENIQHGSADIARQKYAFMVRFQHSIQQRSGCALALGAGDADEYSFCAFEKKSGGGRTLHTTFERLYDFWRMPGNPGRFDNQII